MKKSKPNFWSSPPNLSNLANLLQSWKLLIISLLVGGLLGAAVYSLFPPAYRARAVVVMDQNLEEVFPVAPDREIFYFLERETQKLEELAWSDLVMQKVAEEVGQVSVADLRGGMLQLSQPSDGGWRFYASNADPEIARKLANSWAGAFEEIVQAGVADARKLVAARKELGSIDPATPRNAARLETLQQQVDELTKSSFGIHPEIEVFRSQKSDLPIDRSVKQGAYIFAGAIIGLVLMAVFFTFKQTDHVSR